MQVMGYSLGMTSTDLVTTPGVSSALVAVDGTVWTLPNLVAAWLGSLRTDNTRQAYARDMREWLTWTDSRGRDPLAVRRADVDAYRLTLEEEGLRPTTRARRLAALSSFYRYAETVEVLGANPVANIARPKTSEAYVDLTPALDREETGRLLASATSPRDRALVLVLTVQALRVSEALSLDLDRTEIVRGHVTYVVTGKGGRVDRVPLPPVVADALAAVGKSEDRTSGPVFLGESGEPLSRHGVTRALARLGRAAGLSRTLHPHMLRATAITRALDEGASLRDVQDLARHSDPKTTRRYDRNRGALDRHASYVIAAALSESVSV